MKVNIDFDFSNWFLQAIIKTSKLFSRTVRRINDNGIAVKISPINSINITPYMYIRGFRCDPFYRTDTRCTIPVCNSYVF